MPSGDVHCGQDIGFSFQHSVMSLENGNIVTFDNGNLSTFINNTSSAISRILEIDPNNCINPTLEFSYDLPSSLFGFASGNAQKLDNGNYFINTTGDGGTVLEVDAQGELLWSINLGLTWPNGSGYRAYRLPSIHPGAFSVNVENFKTISLNDSTYNIIQTGADDNFIKLYKRFCPGPISFVLKLKRNSCISKNVTNNFYAALGGIKTKRN